MQLMECSACMYARPLVTAAPFVVAGATAHGWWDDDGKRHWREGRRSGGTDIHEEDAAGDIYASSKVF